MIPILDAAGAPHIRIPLWSDPAIQQANTSEAVSEYIASGDPSVLEVPSYATIITIRALSAAEMGAAARAAGRRPQLGAVVAQRKAEARKSIGSIETEEGAQAFACWLDALDDTEAAALEAWDAYESARFERIAAAGVVKVEHPGQTWTSAADFLGMVPSPSMREGLAHEFGYRVQAYSGLGTRPKGLHNSASGSAKPTEVGASVIGDVTAASQHFADSVGTAAAHSAPA